MHTTSRKNHLNIVFAAIAACLTLSAGGRAFAADFVTSANGTIDLYKKTDPSLARFFETSVGYAVFSTIGKGGAGVGGAYGAGVLYEKGAPIGRTSLTQVTIGVQLGAQTYSEIIFFETQQALEEFKSNQFAFSAQASAVALKSGASTNAKYRGGVAVFTATKGGLMFEGSVGGQRFGYKPLQAQAQRRQTSTALAMNSRTQAH